MGFQTEHLEDEIRELKEANAQLAEKIKMQSCFRENAELKLKEYMRVYRPMKAALKFYAEESNWTENQYETTTEDYSIIEKKDVTVHKISGNMTISYGGKLARKVLKEL